MEYLRSLLEEYFGKLLANENEKIEIENSEFLQKKSDLNEILSKFETIQNEPLELLSEKYEKIFRELDIRREEAKLQIDQHYDELINQINKDKQDKLNQMKNIMNKIDFESSKHFLQELEEKSLQIEKNEMENLKSTVERLGKELDRIEQIQESPVLYKLENQELNIESYFGHLKLFEEEWKCKSKLKSNFEGKCVKTLDGHRGFVSNAIFIDETEELVTSSYDKTIKIWDTSSGNCLRTLQGHKDKITCMQIVNNQIFTGSNDKTIKIWDKNTGECVKTLNGHNLFISCLAVDSRRIFSASGDNTIKIWNISSGKIINTLEGDQKIVFLALLNSKILISVGLNIKKWNIEYGRCEQTLNCNYPSPFRCATLLDQNLLLTGSENGVIREFDLKRFYCRREFVAHNGKINCLKALENEQLITGSTDGLVKIWDFKNRVSKFSSIMAHINGVSCLNVSSNGRLVSGSSSIDFFHYFQPLCVFGIK